MKSFVFIWFGVLGVLPVCAQNDASDLTDIAKNVVRIPDRYPLLEINRSDAGLELHFNWIGYSLTEPDDIRAALRKHAEVKSSVLPPIVVELQVSPSISVDELLPVIRLLSGAKIRFILIDDFVFEFAELPKEGEN